ATEGWTLKQIGKEIPLTDSARDVLELAQRFAAQGGAATVEPVHVLCGIVFQPRNPARRALEAMGADMAQLEALRVAGGGAAPSLTLPLSILLVVGGWVTSLCIHEFGHAVIAYLGGDRSVASAGYLSLNPLKYTHPVLSIALPVVFLLIGGIGLPGGAVYLNERAIRNDRWRSFASAAGPLGNLLFAVLIGWPFLVFRGAPPFGDFHFWTALAFLVFLQVTAVVLNLIPIPPFDGFGMIAPWLSIELRIFASRLGMLPLLILFFLLWQGGPISAIFWNFVYSLTNLLNVPEYLIYLGQHQFLP